MPASFHGIRNNVSARSIINVFFPFGHPDRSVFRMPGEEPVITQVHEK
jgi:hypothetical protein